MSPGTGQNPGVTPELREGRGFAPATNLSRIRGKSPAPATAYRLASQQNMKKKAAPPPGPGKANLQQSRPLTRHLESPWVDSAAGRLQLVCKPAA